MRKRTERLMRATLGGFPWWKSVSMIGVRVVFAYGMGLRYGTPATAWATVAPEIWNPVATHANADEAGNVQITFAAPEGRARGKAITTPADGAVQWSRNAGEAHWTRALPMPTIAPTAQPTLPAERRTQRNQYPAGRPLDTAKIEDLAIIYTNQNQRIPPPGHRAGSITRPKPGSEIGPGRLKHPIPNTVLLTTGPPHGPPAGAPALQARGCGPRYPVNRLCKR